MINLNKVKILLGKEVKTILRDKKSVFTFLFFSVLFMPMLILGIGVFQKTLEESNAKKIITVGYKDNSKDQEFINYLKETKAFNLVESKEYLKDFEDEKIKSYIETNSSDGILNIKFIYDERLNDSVTSLSKIQSFVDAYSKEAVSANLKKKNLSLKDINPVVLQTNTLQELKDEKSSSFLGNLLPYIILLSLIQAAIQVAIELTAGEKERGTMITSLSFDATRQEIALSKILTIFIYSLISSSLNLLSLFITFKFLTKLAGGAGIPDNMFSISTISILQILIIILPLTILTSTILILIGLFSRNQKEGNLYATPLIILMIFIGLAAPAFDLNSSKFIFMIPILSHVALIKQALLNSFTWNNYLISLSTTLFIGYLLILFAAKMFGNEKIIFRK